MAAAVYSPTNGLVSQYGDSLDAVSRILDHPYMNKAQAEPIGLDKGFSNVCSSISSSMAALQVSLSESGLRPANKKDEHARQEEKNMVRNESLVGKTAKLGRNKDGFRAKMIEEDFEYVDQRRLSFPPERNDSRGVYQNRDSANRSQSDGNERLYKPHGGLSSVNAHQAPSRRRLVENEAVWAAEDLAPMRKGGGLNGNVMNGSAVAGKVSGLLEHGLWVEEQVRRMQSKVNMMRAQLQGLSLRPESDGISDVVRLGELRRMVQGLEDRVGIGLPLIPAPVYTRAESPQRDKGRLPDILQQSPSRADIRQDGKSSSLSGSIDKRPPWKPFWHTQEKRDLWGGGSVSSSYSSLSKRRGVTLGS